MKPWFFFSAIGFNVKLIAEQQLEHIFRVRSKEERKGPILISESDTLPSTVFCSSYDILGEK